MSCCMSKIFPGPMQKFAILLIVILKFETMADEDENYSEDSVTTTNRNIEVGETFSKCYDELGCINTDETWFHKKIRPVNLKPLDREVIKSQFILLRKNRTCSQHNDILSQVVTPVEDSISNSGYINDTFLFVLIHDFTGNGYSGWIKHITRVLKSRTKKCNIISVDWHAGAAPPYDQAIANARVVGLEIVYLLKFLKVRYKLAMNQVHIVGHGVGAHIAGYVGRIMKIYKITGLDPSGPRFDGMPPHVRLDAGDASYVEVLHTDAIEYNSQGAKGILGHTDFFINNADLQPGCPSEQPTYDLLSVTRDMLNEGQILPGCSHKRSYKYYIESLELEECTFLGIKCENYLEFRQGKCTKCGTNCRTFGLIAYSEQNNGSYFLQTGPKHPFCLYQYRVSVQIKGDKVRYYGSFQFILIDRNHHVTTSSMSEPREFRTGSNNSFVFYAGVPEMGLICRAKIGWKKKTISLCLIDCKRSINVERVDIQSLNSNTRFSQEVSLCPKDNETEIRSGEFHEFSVC